MQQTLKTLVWAFERVGLHTNLGKTKSNTFTAGFISGQLGQDTKKRRVTVKGATFQEQKWMSVSCNKCGILIALTSLLNHIETIHWSSL